MREIILFAQQTQIGQLGLKLDYTINIGNFSILVAILIAALRTFRLVDRMTLKVNAMWKVYCKQNNIDPEIFDLKQDSLIPSIK